MSVYCVCCFQEILDQLMGIPSASEVSDEAGLCPSCQLAEKRWAERSASNKDKEVKGWKPTLSIETLFIVRLLLAQAGIDFKWIEEVALTTEHMIVKTNRGIVILKTTEVANEV